MPMVVRLISGRTVKFKGVPQGYIGLLEVEFLMVCVVLFVCSPSMMVRAEGERELALWHSLGHTQSDIGLQGIVHEDRCGTVQHADWSLPYCHHNRHPTPWRPSLGADVSIVGGGGTMLS
jgi:hypothetical protein